MDFGDGAEVQYNVFIDVCFIKHSRKAASVRMDKVLRVDSKGCVTKRNKFLFYSQAFPLSETTSVISSACLVDNYHCIWSDKKIEGDTDFACVVCLLA